MVGEVDAGGLKNAIAHVFRLRGKSRLGRAELTFALAYELKWLTPEECGEAIAIALREGLLREEGGKLAPAFNVKEVQVPRDFRLSLAPKTLLDKIIGLLESTGLSRDVALDMIAKKEEQFGGLVVPEVAALALAKERKLNIDEYLDEAYAMLKNGE